MRGKGPGGTSIPCEIRVYKDDTKGDYVADATWGMPGRPGLYTEQFGDTQEAAVANLLESMAEYLRDGDFA